MNDFKFAPGISGYGTQGVDGSAGTSALGFYFSELDGDESRSTIESKIVNNKILFSSVDELLPGYPDRVYQVGDIFIDKNGKVFKITDPTTGDYENTGAEINTSGLFIEGVTGGSFTRWANDFVTQKVIIDNVCCDDTYYGCIDWTTGKFQLTVPDDCCGCECCSCPCNISENDSICFPANETPEELCLIVSGIRRCLDNGLWDGNGTYCLTQDPDDDDDWQWKGTIESGEGEEEIWIIIEDAGGNGTLSMGENAIPRTFGYFFDENFGCSDIQGWNTGICNMFTYTNEVLIGDCGGFNKGYGGQAVLKNPCNLLIP